MKRRGWLVGAAILLALTGGVDTGAWLLATQALRRGVDNWVEQQRATGTEISIGPTRRGGWPSAANLAFDVQAGPTGVPGGMMVRAALVTELSPLHPRVVRTQVARLRIAAADGAELMATAEQWWIDTTLTGPQRADLTARDLRLAWRGHAATIASLSAQVSAQPSSLATSPMRILLHADEIDLGESGLILPVGFGPTVRSIEFLGTLRGGLPPVAPMAEASARAWRDAGGSLVTDRLALSYGPLAASLAGTIGLDEALRPSGTGEAAVSGLLPSLAALGAAGAIPSHTAQAAGGVLALLGGGGSDAPGETGAGAVRLPVALTEGRLEVAGFPVARLPHLPWQPDPGQPDPGQPKAGPRDSGQSQ